MMVSSCSAIRPITPASNSSPLAAMVSRACIMSQTRCLWPWNSVPGGYRGVRAWHGMPQHSRLFLGMPVRTSGRHPRRDRPRCAALWETGIVDGPCPEHLPWLLCGVPARPRGHPGQTPPCRLENRAETSNGFGNDDCPGHTTWRTCAEGLGSAQTSYLQHDASLVRLQAARGYRLSPRPLG